jgi:cathepsin D
MNLECSSWTSRRDKYVEYLTLYPCQTNAAQVKRDNKFPVVYSNQPTVPNALAINQDGSDFSYFSTVKFGSDGKEMYMLIDTGSANTWVFGSNCKSASCGLHNTFGADDSTTLKMTTKSWTLAYGTGEVDGFVGSDSVAFANYSLDLSFGLATTASDDFNHYPMDGILGFGPPQSNELGTKTIMQALDEQTNLKENILGIHLNRASEGTKDGELIIGGMDKSKFKGNLNYLPTQNPSSWEIKIDDAFVGGDACGFTGKSAMIDTGTSYILMAPADARIVHAKIPGSSNSGESFYVPCGSTTSLQFSLNGVKYNISPKDYVGKPSGSACISNIVGHQAFGPNQWILGDVFLKNVYTVFDFDKDRIGELVSHTGKHH